MKYCKNCSAVLGDLDVFCSECGASVDLNDTAATPNANNVNPTPNTEYTQTNFDQNNNQSQDTSSFNGGYQQPPVQPQQPQQNYNQYNNYNQQPAGKSPGQIWMILSIISFLCCGGLLAVPSFVFALLSNQSFNRGDVADAEQKANTAKILFFVAIGVTVVIYIVAFATGIFSGASEFYTY